jgi:hypothetical protein
MVDARARAAAGWFGYGCWAAPYWFVGMEPGGADEACWYDSWERLGATELSDCREHHIGANYFKWHSGKRPPTQPTWRRLIQLLLSYEGKASDLCAVAAYQRDKWGRSGGDTALVEVSALRARNLSAEIDRLSHQDRRLKVISARLVQAAPTFVVFYGKEYRSIYERITGIPFGIDGTAQLGGTLCVLVAHPAARSIAPSMKTEAWWVSKGRVMRNVTTGVLDSDIIRLLVDKNPKLPTSKSFRRFACYRDRMTFGEYSAELLSRFGEDESRKRTADVKWDSSHGFIGMERNGKRIDLKVPASLMAP